MWYRLSLIFFLATIQGFSQTTPSCSKVTKFKTLLEATHIQPQQWDSAFSYRIVSQLFLSIDPRGMYFIQSERENFLNRAKKYCAFRPGDCSLITDLVPVYKNALTRADGTLHSINGMPVNFNDKDTFRLKFKSTAYPSTVLQLQKQWQQLIKLNLLMDLKEDAIKNYKAALDRNCKKYINAVKRRREVAGGVEEYLLNKLLNAIATSYDPHTAFFSKNEKQSFLDAISSDHFSFGIILQDDAFGNITINRIVPGSSAWDAGNLHVGDVVTTVNSSSPDKIDASLYSADELEEILNSLHEPIVLSVKKVNGEQVSTTLVKQKIREDDNKIKSLILFSKETRLGYVNLPVFFSPSELSNSGCAAELAKEIIQLKKANVQGLILDLRNNGGGDLDEAVKLAGIFIDRGALAILRHHNGEIITLKDANPGIAFDGPLLILVNGASASASELFAAAMRNHNRAIIAGSRTYGKGTGQSVMAFDKNEIVKITSLRFYDATGKSHQGKGLNPDILLPDLFNFYDYSETSQRYVLQADSVIKKTYYTPLPPLPLQLLGDSAKMRISKNKFFANLKTTNSKKNPYINTQGITIPLTVNDILAIDAEKNKIKETNDKFVSQYAIRLTSFDQQVQGIDEFGSETFKILINEVSKDQYINESFSVLKQYLKIQHKQL